MDKEFAGVKGIPAKGKQCFTNTFFSGGLGAINFKEDIVGQVII